MNDIQLTPEEEAAVRLSGYALCPHGCGQVVYFHKCHGEHLWSVEGHTDKNTTFCKLGYWVNTSRNKRRL